MVSTYASAVFGPTPGWVISNFACGFSSAACCTAQSSVPICWFNIASSPSKSSRRHAAQGFKGNSRNIFCPAWLHSVRFFCTPLFKERCCSSFFTRLRMITSLCRCNTNCRGQIALLPVRHPQARESAFDHQLQNMRRVPPVRLLLAYVTGPDLRRISDPDLVPQVLDQFDEPLTVARGLHPDQYRRRRTESGTESGT